MRTVYQRSLQALIVLDVLVMIVLGGSQLFFSDVPQEPGPDVTNGTSNGSVGTEQDIAVRWARSFASAQETVDVAALVYNPNDDVGARLFSYTFTLRGGESAIYEVSGTSYILPQSERLVVLPRVRVGFTILDISFNVTDVHWERPEEFQNASLAVGNSTFEQPASRSGFAAQAAGIVRNNSLVGLRNIDISLLVRDEQGEVVGVNKTDIQTVLPREERLIEMFWPQKVEGVVGEPQFFLSSNIFDADNIIRPGSAEFIQLQHELEDRQNR